MGNAQTNSSLPFSYGTQSDLSINCSIIDANKERLFTNLSSSHVFDPPVPLVFLSPSRSEHNKHYDRLPRQTPDQQLITHYSPLKETQFNPHTQEQRPQMLVEDRKHFAQVAEFNSVRTKLSPYSQRGITKPPIIVIYHPLRRLEHPPMDATEPKENREDPHQQLQFQYSPQSEQIFQPYFNTGHFRDQANPIVGPLNDPSDPYNLTPYKESQIIDPRINSFSIPLC